MSLTDDGDTWSVYALCDPDSGMVYWVGVSINPVGRLKSHLSSRNNPRERNQAKKDWLCSLVARGLRPSLMILQTWETPEESWREWKTAEAAWVAHYLAAGHPLTNISPGGYKVSNATVEKHRVTGVEWHARRKKTAS